MDLVGTSYLPYSENFLTGEFLVFKLKLSDVLTDPRSVGVFLPESELSLPYSPSFLGGNGILLIGDSLDLSETVTSSLELLEEVFLSPSLRRPYSPSLREGKGITGLDGELLDLSAASALELAEAFRLLLEPSPSLSLPYSPSLRSLLEPVDL